MKKLFVNLRVIIASSFILFSLISVSQPFATAVKDIDYTYSQTSGTNGCAVAWNPVRQIYVAVIAGNETFPMEAFNTSGKKVFEAEAGFDWRGLWYNPSTKKFEGNGAGEFGIANFGIDVSGLPEKPVVIISGQNQPDFQSIGTYDYQKKQFAYYNSSADEIKFYTRKKNTKVGTLKLNMKVVKSENLNMSYSGFTGKKNYEFVLFDYVEGKLYFYNRKGEKTAETKLPTDASLNYSFGFSYCNDRAFLYDKEFRVWRGYKVF
jgi:hypothetical protein